MERDASVRYVGSGRATLERLRSPALRVGPSPPQLVTTHCFEGHFHEIFNEPGGEKEIVFDVLHEWLEANFPGRAESHGGF